MQNSDNNIAKNSSGWKRLPRATLCSLKGLKAAWVFESGFRQYTCISLVLLPISFYIAENANQWLMLLATLFLLLICEIVNSAIEAVSDTISTQYHPLIGRAKDLGSAAVFLALILVIITWAVAVYRYFV